MFCLSAEKKNSAFFFSNQTIHETFKNSSHKDEIYDKHWENQKGWRHRRGDWKQQNGVHNQNGGWSNKTWNIDQPNPGRAKSLGLDQLYTVHSQKNGIYLE